MGLEEKWLGFIGNFGYIHAHFSFRPITQQPIMTRNLLDCHEMMAESFAYKNPLCVYFKNLILQGWLFTAKWWQSLITSCILHICQLRICQLPFDKLYTH